MKVGILGSGQLGAMMAQESAELGLEVIFFDEKLGEPSEGLGEFRELSFSEPPQVELFGDIDVITYEFENIPNEFVGALTELKPVYPPLAALETASDRLQEKELFQSLGIETAEYIVPSSMQEIRDFIATEGAILKTRRMGYDGKGQYRLSAAGDVSALELDEEAIHREEFIVERIVPFGRELSVVAVRTAGGKVMSYPLAENEHRGGILRVSKAPAVSSAALAKLANKYALKVLEALEYVGVFALELFDCSVDGEPRLLANEMAPRVHNSGHWTQTGARTSQFAAHLLAVSCKEDFELGPFHSTTMLNIIGERPKFEVDFFSPSWVHLQDYRKSAREGRKLGHVNVLENKQSSALIAELSEALTD